MATLTKRPADLSTPSMTIWKLLYHALLDQNGSKRARKSHRPPTTSPHLLQDFILGFWVARPTEGHAEPSRPSSFRKLPLERFVQHGFAPGQSVTLTEGKLVGEDGIELFLSEEWGTVFS